MPLTAKILNDLIKTYQQFESTLSSEKPHFLKFKQDFNGEKCPVHTDLIPLLYGLKKIASSLADFLNAYIIFLQDQDAIELIRDTPLSDRNISSIKVAQIHPIYDVIYTLNLKLESMKTPTTFVWEQTYDLFIMWFAYFGAGMSADSGLICMLGILTNLFSEKKDSKLWGNDYLNFYRDYILKKEALIDGLYHISERANLVATVTEEELKLENNVITYWCRQVDSIPKDGNAYYSLDYMLKRCPNPAHPEIIARLEQITKEERLAKHLRKQASNLLKGIVPTDF